MITVTLPFDENDPMYARNCGSRKTDVYLFEIAGYALACDMGGVSPDAEHIPDTMKGLTRNLKRPASFPDAGLFYAQIQKRSCVVVWLLGARHGWGRIHDGLKKVADMPFRSGIV